MATSDLGTQPDHTVAMTDAKLPAIVVLGRDTCEDTIRSNALLVERGSRSPT